MNLGEAVRPLLEWYRENARDLPWRGADPYGIWVSEIMLQQTRVEAVKPYYLRFVEELADIRALAEVSDDRLHKLWEGLGYYSRARNLKKAAGQVMERFGGRLPANYDDLLSLAGVGAYTAGAVASIAFGLPCPAVDGNVLRVLARLRADDTDISLPRAKKEAEDALRRIMPKDATGDFTQALMELGAVVCLPNGAPLCGECPLAGLCAAKRNGSQGILPVKAAKKQRRVEEWTVIVAVSGGRLALEKRPDSGLLAGLWGLPVMAGHVSPEEAAAYLRKRGLRAEGIGPAGGAKHIFTHVEWRMRGYLAQTRGAGGFAWADAEELRGRYALPAAFRKYRQAFLAYLGEKPL